MGWGPRLLLISLVLIVAGFLRAFLVDANFWRWGLPGFACETVGVVLCIVGA
jgi:hypothetical protein